MNRTAPVLIAATLATIIIVGGAVVALRKVSNTDAPFSSHPLCVEFAKVQSTLAELNSPSSTFQERKWASDDLPDKAQSFISAAKGTNVEIDAQMYGIAVVTDKPDIVRRYGETIRLKCENGTIE